MATTSDALPMVTTADHVTGMPQGKWTYADYAALPDDGRRYEIINGMLYMPPAPSMLHQAANRWFVFYLTTYVQLTGLGQVFSAPCDVELAPNVVVQPDVIIVLNTNLGIITPSHIVGVPDLLVEITSPGTVGYDRRTKQDAYARVGVPEYWIADPAAQTIEVLQLERDSYRSAGVFQGQATLPSRIVPGLPVRVAQFFA
jgi:Uma2 family endonuclease